MPKKRQTRENKKRSKYKYPKDDANTHDENKLKKNIKKDVGITNTLKKIIFLNK